MQKKMNPFLKFSIWMVVIIIMMVVAFIKDNKENHWLDDLKTEQETNEKDNNEEKEVVSYQLMQDILSDNNYDFVFTITNDYKYVYTGRRCNGLEEGFKEDKNGVIKYIINIDEKVYKIVDDNYSEINDLYTGFNSDFLNVGKLFNNLKDVLYTEKLTSEGTEYSYEKEGYQVVVLVVDEHISKINIINDTTTYNLLFNNIGKCNKIEFIEQS